MAVTRDFGDGRTWRKSSRSSDQGGEYVFVAVDAARVGVRDSKEGATGPTLWVGHGDWKLLTRHLNG